MGGEEAVNGRGHHFRVRIEPFQRLAAPFPSRLGGANRMGPIPAGRAALEARRHIFTFFICKIYPKDYPSPSQRKELKPPPDPPYAPTSDGRRVQWDRDFGGLMATKGNGSDDGPAQGWNIFKWKWVAEPPVALAAALYGVLFIIFLLIAISGVVALWQLLAPIWTSGSPAPSSQATDTGAELRGRLLIIGAVLTTPFLIWRLIVGHWAARAAQEQARVAQETARNTLFTKAIEQLGATREEKKRWQR